MLKMKCERLKILSRCGTTSAQRGRKIFQSWRRPTTTSSSTGTSTFKFV